MSRDIPESDWKAFRNLREVALERFCERVLGEIGGIASNGATSWHDRYLKIFKLIDEQDDELALMFNDARRSVAIMQILAMHVRRLLTPDEMLRFTPETRERVESLADIPSSTRARKRG